MERRERAEQILQDYRPGHYEYLGAGFAGVVFHDGKWVYKVHTPLPGVVHTEPRPLAYLASRLDAFRDAKHLYALREVARQADTDILVYPYEPSEAVTTASVEDWCSFLAEIFERRLIVRSVSLASNFRRAGGVLKLIDYEVEPYDDNLFLNMVARAFVQLPNIRDRVLDQERFRRSTINRFDLPELDGFSDFLTQFARTVSARGRRAAVAPRWPLGLASQGASLDDPRRVAALLGEGRRTLTLSMDAIKGRDIHVRALDSGYRVNTTTVRAGPGLLDSDAPVPVEFGLQPLIDPPQPVTLLIKACVQDCAVLARAVEHVVLGLSGPERFAERILALDLTEGRRYPRQFDDSGTAARLLETAQALVVAGFVDRLVAAPQDEASVRDLNRRWFGIDSLHTHTVKGVPVCAQLHAFESVRTDAILQVDIDALVGVRNAEHPYLRDMLAPFADSRVVSVAFPICRSPDEGFQDYFGHEEGGFVPEVRCCLLLRSRLEALRPLPNGSEATGLEKGWYRAVESRQKETGACSLRGGPGARFFIHPQNYRKAYPTTWPALMDRVERLAVPDMQVGQPEVRGSLADWMLPARHEGVVVVVVMREESPSQAYRMLLDLECQTAREFGVILVDASGRRRAGWTADLSGFDRQRITTVDRPSLTSHSAAVLEAVRGFVRRDDAIVCLLEAGDVLLGTDMIADVRDRMNLYASDVLLGKELSTARLSSAGKHSHDLVAPRRAPESIPDGMFAVRRYVLDALDLRDVRVARADKGSTNTFSRLSKSHEWAEDRQLMTLLVPSVELGRRPICTDHFQLHRASRPVPTPPELLEHLRARPAKEAGSYVRGRKTFLPNLSRIEIDITYDCNLKCQACNRSCTQAPTKDAMDLEQVRAFVRESTELGRRWEVINVLGGEPTLHPAFHAIIGVLLEGYVDAFSPDTVIQVTSNGFGEKVRESLDALPRHPRLVVNRESFKDTTRIPYFTPFNDAPADDPEFAGSDYGKGCWVTSYCGIGLNHLGYFPCAVAGGIERVLGSGGAVTRLAEVNESIADALHKYCRLCGNYKHYHSSRGDFVPRSEKDVFEAPVVSASWERLYALRRKSK